MTPMLAMTPSVITAAIWPRQVSKARSTAGEIIPGHYDGVLEGPPVQPRAIGDLDRIVPMTQRDGGLRMGIDQKIVEPTVVVPLELEELRLAGEAASQTNGRHGGLGAGVCKSNPLGTGNMLMDQLGDLGLDLCGGREMVAVAGGVLNRGYHRWVRVTEGQGAVGEHPIHVAVAIHVPDPGAAGPIDEDRVLAVVGRTPGGRATALHHDSEGTSKERFRFLGCEGHLQPLVVTGWPARQPSRLRRW